MHVILSVVKVPTAPLLPVLMGGNPVTAAVDGQLVPFCFASRAKGARRVVKK